MAKLVSSVIFLSLLGFGPLFIYLDRDTPVGIFSQEETGNYQVVSTKRWHWQTFGCTYSIVKLNSAIKPVTSPQKFSKFVQVKRGKLPYWPQPDSWQATPFKPGNWNPEAWNFNPNGINGGMTGSFHHCLLEIDAANREAILREIALPGSWYAVHYENVAFVLPKSRLVGTLRYGD